MDAADDLSNKLYGIDFGIAKSMRYHSHVRGNWASADRANKILGFVSGSAVVAGVIGGIPWLSGTSGFAVAMFSGLDLVLDFGRHERLHDDLYRRFSVLRRKAVKAGGDLTSAILADLERERLEIEADEPNVFRWVERRCSRDEAVSRGVAVNPIWLETRWTAVRNILPRAWGGRMGHVSAAVSVKGKEEQTAPP